MKEKVKLVLGHPLCVTINILVCFVIINSSLDGKFKTDDCKENTFENDDEICQPCLPELKDPFCLSCVSETQCTSCQYGNVLKTEPIPLSISYL